MTAAAPPLVFGNLPGDAQNTVDEAPPSAPFENAGFEVVEASWDNRPLWGSRFPLPALSIHTPRVAALRERYDFLEHMATGESEFERLLLLRNWLRTTINVSLRDETGLTDPFAILDQAATRGFLCTQFGAVMHACAVASGWVAQTVHIDHDHGRDERSASHAVAEVWVNELRKWVALDAMYDCHYEKDGVPLSVAELCAEYVADGGEHVTVHRGVQREPVERARRTRVLVRGEVSGYFWNKFILGQTPFGGFGSAEPDMQVSFIGPAHEGKTWWQGRPPNNYVLHAIQRGALHFTRRLADVNPDIGTCLLRLTNETTVTPETGERQVVPDRVRVSVRTYTPAFDALLVSIDGAAYVPLEGTHPHESVFAFAWPLHEGENTLAVRTRNEFGLLGAPTTVRVVLRRK